MSSVSKERNASSSSSSASLGSDNDGSEIMSPSEDSSSISKPVEYKYSAEEVAVMMESLAIDDTAGLNDALTTLVQTSPEVAGPYVPKILQTMSTDVNSERETIDRVGAWLLQLMQEDPLLSYFDDILEYSIKTAKKLDEYDCIAAQIVILVCMRFATFIPANLEQDIASFWVRLCEKAAEKTLETMNDDVDFDNTDRLMKFIERPEEGLAFAIMEAGDISAFLYKLVADRLQDHEDWKRRYAAAAVLSLCLRQCDDEHNKKIDKAAKISLMDTLPTVRYAAVGQIRVILRLTPIGFFTNNPLVRALIATLADPVVRVAAAAAAAIGDCIQDIASYDCYRSNLMSALVDCLDSHCQLLVDEEKSGMLCQIVYTICDLGRIDGSSLRACSDKLTQPLKNIIRAPDTKQVLLCVARQCLEGIDKEILIEKGFTAKEVAWAHDGCQELADEEEEEGDQKKEVEEKNESRPQRTRRPVNRLIVDPTKKSYESTAGKQ